MRSARGIGLFFTISRQAWRSYSEDRAIRLGASLAYYSLFALAPLLFLAISLAGLVIGQETAHGELQARLQSVLGPEVAELVADLIEGVASPAATSSLQVVSLIVLVFGASVLFGAWRDALNLIFDVPWRTGLKASLRRRVVSFALVGLFGATILAMVLAQTIVEAIEVRVAVDIVDAGLSAFLIIGPYAFGTLLLAFMYRFAPDTRFEWREVWLGTIPAAIALGLGTWLYGRYLSSIGQVTATSVAGAVFLLLAWIYYSAQILLFGAELIKTLDARRLPGSDALGTG